MTPEQYRERIAALVEDILEKARSRRRKTGLQPLGRAAILAQNAFDRPKKTKKSPAPLVHAFRKKVRQELYEAYRWFVAAFREAAEKLRAGDRMARLPFVGPPLAALVSAG